MPEPIPSYVKSYEDGRDAAHAGLLCNACPHELATEEYDDWVSGWEDARSELSPEDLLDLLDNNPTDPIEPFDREEDR